MANTLIQIKRYANTPAPPNLAAGELAYSYNTQYLFVGSLDGSNVLAIASPTVNHFIVVYLAGAPDYTVSSANNLTPTY